MVKRIARKPHRCAECRHDIAVGEEYYRHTLPPGAEPFYSKRWVTIVMCGKDSTWCRDYWAVDGKRTEELLVP